MKNIVTAFIALICVAAFATTAAADATGVYETTHKGRPSGKFTIEYRDEANFRISFGQGGAMMHQGTFFSSDQGRRS